MLGLFGSLNKCDKRSLINEVLTELLKEDANGVTGIEQLVNKHLGLE